MPFMDSHHLLMFGGHWSGASGDIKFNMSHELTKPRD